MQWDLKLVAADVVLHHQPFEGTTVFSGLRSSAGDITRMLLQQIPDIVALEPLDDKSLRMAEFR